MNIILDFDSTIVQAEGLDVLAEISLKNEDEISKFKDYTQQGMAGVISFEESLRLRIAMLSIKEDILGQVVEFLSTKISPTIASIQELHRYFPHNFYVVSGGFIEYILPICRQIGFLQHQIFANQFIQKNKIWTYDSNNTLSQSNGKSKCIKALELEGKTIMVGDGYTDLQAKMDGAVDMFVAYTETIYRKNVAEKADKDCKNFGELASWIEQYED